jgi:hypothetical protein
METDGPFGKGMAMMIIRSVLLIILSVGLFSSCADDGSTDESGGAGAAAAADGAAADDASNGGDSDAAVADSGGEGEDGEAGTGAEEDAALPPCEPAEVSTTYTWSFDDDAVDSSPAEFTDVLGTWKVEADTDAPSAPNILRQSGTSSPIEYPVLFADSPCFRDLTLKVRCRPESGVIDQACGLVFRLQDGDNYYVARANVLESNVRLYHVIDGLRQQFATAEGITIAGNEWHTLQAKTSGATLTVWFDGEEVISTEDETFAESGRIGLWLKADSVTSFDDLEATAE